MNTPEIEKLYTSRLSYICQPTEFLLSSNAAIATRQVSTINAVSKRHRDYQYSVFPYLAAFV